MNLRSAIGTELLKNDFYKELNENIFFTTRSLLHELGNFTKKKNTLIKKLVVLIKRIRKFFCKIF